MQKIRFNTLYGLEDLAIKGLKTVTRIIIPHKILMKYGVNKYSLKTEYLIRESKYKVGEIVAIAQCYKSFATHIDKQYKETFKDGRIYHLDTCEAIAKAHNWKLGEEDKLAGWNNKMFIKAELMPHQQRCISVRIERLQNISDDDCLKEGVTYFADLGVFYFDTINKDEGFYFDTAREAFASLTDKVDGKGTWDKNPFVWRYEFELVK